MNSNLSLAINGLIALNGLARQLADEIGETAEVIRQAQAEDRDLTDDEMAAVESRREAAVEAWNNRGDKSGA